MNDLDSAIQTVRHGPEGPNVGAFFDLDGTLVKGFTALAFLREDLWHIGVRRLYDLIRDVIALRDDPDRDLKAIERAAELLGGRSVAELETAAQRIFARRIAPTIRPGARDLIRAHLRKGHTVAMATAATPFQARPVAADLEIPHLISTEVEIVDGRLTGRLDGPPGWGVEKAKGVQAFAAAHGIDLSQSYGYGNGGEDEEFLRTVGRPVATCPDHRLAAFATAAGVPTLQLPDPTPVDLRGISGTLGALGVFNAGIATALLAKVLSRGRWRAVNPTVGYATDLCLWVAGIDVRVQGREHIEAGRPGVYIFNHQSNLDPAVVGKLLRHDFTGVGKREMASDPRAWALRYLDVALIDRSDSATARASVNALIDRIHEGESVLIAPEGTRMPTAKLGPFKKGAFHLALDAQAPLIPIVIRNSGEHWPRTSVVIRPGTVDVCVLPPIITTDWKREELNDRVGEVRALFERTLADWPKSA